MSREVMDTEERATVDPLVALVPPQESPKYEFTVMQWGVFDHDSGDDLIEDGLWSRPAAWEAERRHRANGHWNAEARQICPDHPGQPWGGCWQCGGDEWDD